MFIGDLKILRIYSYINIEGYIMEMWVLFSDKKYLWYGSYVFLFLFGRYCFFKFGDVWLLRES